MKVLKDNYTMERKEINSNTVKPYPRKTICENCGSELEYEESDLRIGEYGCAFVDCPLCGKDNMLDDNERNITLTRHNIEFPTHFHHVSVETGSVDCCNNENVRKYIYEAIEYFRKHKDECDYGAHVTGNLYVNVHRFSGDENYDVTVSNDFYSMYIPFEEEDY